MQLLETIRALEGIPCHLDYHQRRLDHAVATLNMACDYRLETLLNPPREGLYRCRVLYDENSISVTYLPYTPKRFRTLQAVIDDTIDYTLKYADRRELDALYAKRGKCDDIVIVKNGLITDTTIANLAFYDGQRWVTPDQPLLKGTTRQRLLDEGKLIETKIAAEDLHRYGRCAVMNAMLGFCEVENGIILPST